MLCCWSASFALCRASLSRTERALSVVKMQARGVNLIVRVSVHAHTYTRVHTHIRSPVVQMMVGLMTDQTEFTYVVYYLACIYMYMYNITQWRLECINMYYIAYITQYVETCMLADV